MPAGSSGTPLAQRLGIKPGHRVGLVGAAEGFEGTLEGLPDGVRLSRRAAGRFDVILLFTKRAAELERRFAALAAKLYPAGGLWVAWPKKSSGVATDLDFNRVQRTGLDAGLVDNKVCAVNETWSGLRFVHRLKDRPRKKGKKGTGTEFLRGQEPGRAERREFGACPLFPFFPFLPCGLPSAFRNA